MSSVINPQRLTKYERTKIIGQRAVQISNGAKPRIEYDFDMKVEEIAEKELDAHKTPLILRRPMPDGSFVELDLTLNTVLKK